MTTRSLEAHPQWRQANSSPMAAVLQAAALCIPGHDHLGVLKRSSGARDAGVALSGGTAPKCPWLLSAEFLAGRWWCMMSAADRVIRWSTALAVLGVAAVAAVASYEHAYDLVRAHGEAGWTARLVPLTVDGLIYAVRW